MIRTTFAVLLYVLLTPTFATAEEADLIDATKPEVVAELLREEGFRAKLTVTDDGVTQIESAASGTSFWVYFQACDEDSANCEVLNLSAGFDFLEPQPDSIIENWNRDEYTKAYLDDEGDPFLEFTINAKHGITKANLRDTLIWFTDELPEFMEQISWHEETKKNIPT